MNEMIRIPSYGRYLEDFIPGDVYFHPRGITLHSAFAQEFAGTFMESCPLFLTDSYAKALGYERQLVSPLMVLAATLSLGVQNESEKAIAHLGYYNVNFPKPTYAGDTLRAMTRVSEVKFRGAGEPGIVHVETVGLNHHQEVLVRYERKILVPLRAANPSPSATASARAHNEHVWPEDKGGFSPKLGQKILPNWTAGATFFEDFREGEIIAHPNGRTVTEEHFSWTYRLGNTHPLHFDSIYSHAQAAPMGGAPVVYGALVFSWLAGLASRDTTENMVWDLGYTRGYHTQPVRAGDTLYALSRIEDTQAGPTSDTGILNVRLIGVKNIRSIDALEKYGSELFIPENDKKKSGLMKIEEKVFEIERKILVRKRQRTWA